MSANPILELTGDANDPVPLVELKQHFVLFVSDPPGPTSARRVYDLYRSLCGDRFAVFKSTFPYAPLRDWTPEAREHFETTLLPDLRNRAEWGYGFSDGKPRDSWLFMFHGFRPFQEPDKASFYRFEFDWQVDPAFLRGFVEAVCEEVPCLTGYAGYLLQGRSGMSRERASYNRLYALAWRYYGCEVTDVEATAKRMRVGYKCVNWLTVIGEPFRSQFRSELELAGSVAFDAVDGSKATVLQAAERPMLGDRNRAERLPGHSAIARALLPLQIKEHASFGGDRWTEESVMAWLRRFTDTVL
jgi:hypothetical protein